MEMGRRGSGVTRVHLTIGLCHPEWTCVIPHGLPTRQNLCFCPTRSLGLCDQIPTGVFTDRHHEALKDIFSDTCNDFGASLVACDGEGDHVHLLIEYPPTVELSKLVNSLKGVSSRLLAKQFYLKTQKGNLWSPSYFAASCGGAPLSIIKGYVESQRSDSLTRP